MEVNDRDRTKKSELPEMAGKKDDIMVFKKKYILLVIVLIFVCLACVCIRKNEIKKRYFQEDSEKFILSEEKKKGFALPVDRQEREEAENDCKRVM